MVGLGRRCAQLLVFSLLVSVCQAQEYETLQQSCVRPYEERILQSCDYRRTDDWNVATPRLAFASMLHHCMGDGVNPTPRPLRIIGPEMAFTTTMQELTSGSNTSFSSVTGIPINFTALSSGVFSLTRAQLLRDPNPPNATSGWDAIIVSPTAFGDADQVPGKLIDLSYVVSEDAVLQWDGIQPQLRSSAVTYNGAIVALPLLPVPIVMFYHMGIFKRDNLTVPRTWDEFLDLAERYHGGPDGLVGACTWLPNCRGESFVLRYILGSFLQTQGPAQGLLWDAETLAPLADTPAMEEALRVMRRLRAVSLNVSTYGGFCVPRDFIKGKCLLGVQETGNFKTCNNYKDPMRGMLGMAPLPGSTRVLDRTTRQLVKCNATICPLAQNFVTEGNETVPINRSPIHSYTVILFNGLSPQTYQFLAYSLFAYITSPNVIGTEGLLLKDNDVLPVRTKDTDPSVKALWVAAGYDPSDVEQFMAVYQATQQSANHNVDLKTRFSSNVTSALLAAGLTAINFDLSTDAAVRKAITDMNTTLAAIVATEGLESFGRQYRRALNWVNNTVVPDEDDKDILVPAPKHFPVVPVAVAVPCGAMLLAIGALAAAPLLVRRRRDAARLAAAALRKPPKLAPSTTLVVTDIQDSTVLWEALDPRVMDTALNVHHRTMRDSIMEHSGYETGTEGDSFIIAFHTPQHAVAFCLAAQQAMLDAPWPDGLLFRPPLPNVTDPWDDAAAVVTMVHRSGPVAHRAPSSSKGRPNKAMSSTGPSRSGGSFLFRRIAPAAPSAGRPNLEGTFGYQGSVLQPANRRPLSLSLTKTGKPRVGGRPSSAQRLAAPVSRTELSGSSFSRFMSPSLNARTPLQQPESIGPVAAEPEGSIGPVPVAGAEGAPVAAGSSEVLPLQASRVSAAASQSALSQSLPGRAPGRFASTSDIVPMARLGIEEVGRVTVRSMAAGAEATGSTAQTSGDVVQVSDTGMLAVPSVDSRSLVCADGSSQASVPATEEHNKPPASGEGGSGSVTPDIGALETAALLTTGMLQQANLSSFPDAITTDKPQQSKLAAPQPPPDIKKLLSSGVCPTGSLMWSLKRQWEPTAIAVATASAGPTAAAVGGAGAAASAMPATSPAILPSPTSWTADESCLSAGAGPVPVSAPAPRAATVTATAAEAGIVVAASSSSFTAGQAGTAAADGTRSANRRVTSYRQGSVTAHAVGDGAVTVFRGLRVRMGCVCAVYPGTDARKNRTSGRMQYSGMSMRMAKAVSDAAHGGMVVISDNVYASLLGNDDGDEELDEAVAASAATLFAKILPHLQLLWLGQHRLGEDLPPVHLIQVMPHGSPMVGRLVLQRPPRTQAGLLPPGSLGALAAPVYGSGAVARLAVTGAAELLAWDMAVASSALELLHRTLLQTLGSVAARDMPYIVEGAMGMGAGMALPDAVVSAVGAAMAAATAPTIDSEGSFIKGAYDSRVPSMSEASSVSLMGRLGVPPGRDSVASPVVPTAGGNQPASLTPSGEAPRTARDRLGTATEAAGSTRAEDPGSGPKPHAQLPAPTSQEVGVPPSSQRAHTGPNLSLTAASARNSVMAPRTVASGISPQQLQALRTVSQASVALAAGASFARKRGPSHVDSARALGKPVAGVSCPSGAPGCMTVVFRDLREATAWLLEVMKVLPSLPWPPELLEHPLCEEFLIDGGMALAAHLVPQSRVPSRVSPQPALRSQPLSEDETLQPPPPPPFMLSTADPLDKSRGRRGGGGGATGEGPRSAAGLSSDTEVAEAAATKVQPGVAAGADGEVTPSEMSATSGAAPGHVLMLRGLRARAAVVYGDLAGDLPPPGTLACQLSYRGRAWTASGAALSKSKPGRVTTNGETAAMLPRKLVDQLNVVKDA